MDVFGIYIASIISRLTSIVDQDTMQVIKHEIISATEENCADLVEDQVKQPCICTIQQQPARAKFNYHRLPVLPIRSACHG